MPYLGCGITAPSVTSASSTTVQLPSSFTRFDIRSGSGPVTGIATGGTGNTQRQQHTGVFVGANLTREVISASVAAAGQRSR